MNKVVRHRLPGTPEPMVMLPGYGDVQIAADHWGETGQPLVLLLHGGGQTRQAWKGTGEKLGAAGYNVYALDSRGNGDSGWAPDGDYSTDAMVKDLVAVSSVLGHDSPVLVGASMGGGVSLSAVGEGLLAARALILVDMASQIEADGAQRILDFMQQRPDGFDSLEQVADAIAAYQPQRERPRVLDGLKKIVRIDEHNRLHWHWDPNWLGEGRVGTMEERTQRLQQAALKLTEMQVPTQLVRGGLSDVLSEEGAQAFLQTCPHAEYLNVTGAAHMVAGDRNDLFTEAVVGFLTRLEQE